MSEDIGFYSKKRGIKMIKDLTVGKPGAVLWRFSLPMFVGVIFQQIYNIADSVIAGRFAGEDALAAVGASYPITMIFMAIAIGSQIGCTIVVSQLFGAKRYRDLKSAVSTAMISGLVLSALLLVIGLLTSKGMMILVNTPENIFADGDLYLRIYIGGFVFLFLYNVATGIFNSMGDSRTPLYFLIGSSLGNIVLDLIFVAVFHWDVAGVAWATLIAQVISAGLVLIRLITTKECYRLILRDIRFHKHALLETIRIGLPGGIQNAVVSFSNLIVQYNINSFGAAAVVYCSATVCT